MGLKTVWREIFELKTSLKALQVTEGFKAWKNCNKSHKTSCQSFANSKATRFPSLSRIFHWTPTTTWVQNSTRTFGSKILYVIHVIRESEMEINWLAYNIEWIERTHKYAFKKRTMHADTMRDLISHCYHIFFCLLLLSLVCIIYGYHFKWLYAVHMQRSYSEKKVFKLIF